VVSVEPVVLGKPRWWQWPTVLSLDAPAVALSWQWLLSWVAGVVLGWHHVFILGASVWLAYAADRWIEGWRLAPEQIRTQRHRFYQHRRWPLAIVWLVMFGLDLTVALARLSAVEFEAGLLLLGPVLLYLLSHQLVHRHHPARAPKEICVALLLTGGVSVFVIPQAGAATRSLLEPIVLFGLLCFANCALISTWEHRVDEAHGQTSFALQYRRARAFSRALPWIIAGVSVFLGLVGPGPVRVAAFCATGSGVLLGAVDRAEHRIGWQLARVLADLVLLTPLIPLFGLRAIS
jgi:hypothetical protein